MVERHQEKPTQWKSTGWGNATNRGLTKHEKTGPLLKHLGKHGIQWNPRTGVLALPWRAHWKAWPGIWALKGV